jgi:hypothetical protein
MKKLCVFLLSLLVIAAPALANGHGSDHGHGDSHGYGDDHHGDGGGCDGGHQPGPCDAFRGVASELCEAYCGELRCATPHPNTCASACTWVKQTFEALTGKSLPCESPTVTCPCGATLPLFGSIVSGGVTVQQCIVDNATQMTSVITPAGTFSLVNQATVPPFCSDNLTLSLNITPQQAAVCQQLLVQAAARQGVACVSPE